MGKGILHSLIVRSLNSGVISLVWPDSVINAPKYSLPEIERLWLVDLAAGISRTTHTGTSPPHFFLGLGAGSEIPHMHTLNFGRPLR